MKNLGFYLGFVVFFLNGPRYKLVTWLQFQLAPKPVMLMLVWPPAELAIATFAEPLLSEHLLTFALKR